MRCRRCDAEIGILDERCGACAADLREIDVRPRPKKKGIPGFQEIVSEPAVSGGAAASFSTVAVAANGLDPFARVRAAEVEVEARALDVVNLGLLTNGIPLVNAISVRNEAGESLEDGLVRVWLAPEIGESWEATIPKLAPGEAWGASNVTPPLDLAALARRREAEPGHLRIEVREEERVIFSASQPVRILAANEWIFLEEREWTLASYVFPNHPPVETVLGHARRHLEAAGWGSAFDGYQSGDRSKVRAMGEAVHEALARDLDLTYINPPPSFETTGQKVFLPGDIEKHHRGTCLDLALFFAGILERAGLAPLVFLIPGHAFAGVWMDERGGGPPVHRDDPVIRQKVARGAILPIEATACTQGMGADQAFRLATQHLEEWPLIAAVDVVAARSHGALPIALPTESP